MTVPPSVSLRASPAQEGGREEGTGPQLPGHFGGTLPWHGGRTTGTNPRCLFRGSKAGYSQQGHRR